MMSLLCKDDAKPGQEVLPLSMPAEYKTLWVPTHRRKRGRPTARAASTLGDRKALDLDSDEEERIEPNVSSPSYYQGKHVLIYDATDILGTNIRIAMCQAIRQDRQEADGKAGSSCIFPVGQYPPSLTPNPMHLKPSSLP